MRLRSKGNFVPSGIQWRIDCDYLHKLPPAERAYMEKFLSDYYFSNQMTSPGGSARGDILTASDDRIAKSCASPLDGNLRKRGSYMPSDYSQSADSPEDALLNAIDRADRKSS